MGATLYGASGAAPAGTPTPRRTDTLALVYQQILTATVRIRANRQAVSDAQAFRTNIHSALRAAEKDGLAKGYSAEDVRLVTTAAVAFLDESILNSSNPVFSDWPRMPLQQELFGHNVAGEAFFENLDRLQNRPDSPDVADVLEVYCLCLLLGFKGRYSLSGPEAVRPVIESLMARIRRIRGPMGGLSPSWSIPDRAVVAAEKDPWVQRLLISAAVCLVLGVLLFVVFELLLSGGISSLRAVSFLIPAVRY